MKPIPFLKILLIFITLLTIGVIPVAAQQPVPSDDDVNAIAREMFCPVCENTPLDVCPTKACSDWREEIRDKLAQGWSEAEIKSYFAERYGDQTLAQPPLRGLNWLLFLLPLCVITAAVTIYVSFLRRKMAPQVQNQPVPSSSENHYVDRLEQELKHRD